MRVSTTEPAFDGDVAGNAARKSGPEFADRYRNNATGLRQPSIAPVVIRTGAGNRNGDGYGVGVPVSGVPSNPSNKSDNDPTGTPIGSTVRRVPDAVAGPYSPVVVPSAETSSIV